MATVTSWGSKKNGCRVGIQYDDAIIWESGSARAKVANFDIRFSSDDPIWDTSNTLSVSGGAVTNNSWSNAFSKSSNWSGTMTIKSNIASEYVELSYGSTTTATCSASLSGISYAGGTLTDSVSITFPARPYALPQTPGTPYFPSVSPGSATVYWVCSGTALNAAQPFTTTHLYIYRHSDGAHWITNSQGWGGSAGSPTFGFVQGGVYPDTQYSFHAYAVNSSGWSADSGWVSLWIPPNQPHIYELRWLSDDVMRLGWKVVNSGRNSVSRFDTWCRDSVNQTWKGKSLGSNYWKSEGGYDFYYVDFNPDTFGYRNRDNYFNVGVHAVNVAGDTPESAYWSINAKLSDPTSVAATAPIVSSPHSDALDSNKQTSQTTLTWSHAVPSFVNSYQVYVDDVLYATTTSQAMTIVGLSAGAQHSFYVVALRDGHASGTSGKVYATTQDTIASSPTSISLGNIVASNGLASGTLSWSAVSGATKYYIQKISGGSATFSSVTTGTSIPITGMAPGSSYVYSVTTGNAVGWGGTGQSSSVTMPVVPAAPQSVTATYNYNSSAVDAVWTAPASNGGAALTGYSYLVEVQGTNGTFSTVQTWTSLGLVNSVSIPLTAGYNYRVSVRAINGIGQGAVTYDETDITGGYIKVLSSGAWGGIGSDKTFIKVYTNGSWTTKVAVVRSYKNGVWTPLTYN